MAANPYINVGMAGSFRNALELARAANKRYSPTAPQQQAGITSIPSGGISGGNGSGAKSPVISQLDAQIDQIIAEKQAQLAPQPPPEPQTQIPPAPTVGVPQIAPQMAIPEQAQPELDAQLDQIIAEKMAELGPQTQNQGIDSYLDEIIAEKQAEVGPPQRPPYYVPEEEALNFGARGLEMPENLSTQPIQERMLQPGAVRPPATPSISADIRQGKGVAPRDPQRLLEMYSEKFGGVEGAPDMTYLEPFPDPKRRKVAQKAASLAGSAAYIAAGVPPNFPIIMEAIQQIRNGALALAEKAPYDPLAERSIAELLGPNTEPWVRSAVVLGEAAIDMIGAMFLSRRLTLPMVRSRIAIADRVLSKAGAYEAAAAKQSAISGRPVKPEDIRSVINQAMKGEAKAIAKGSSIEREIMETGKLLTRKPGEIIAPTGKQLPSSMRFAEEAAAPSMKVAPELTEGIAKQAEKGFELPPGTKIKITPQGTEITTPSAPAVETAVAEEAPKKLPVISKYPLINWVQKQGGVSRASIEASGMGVDEMASVMDNPNLRKRIIRRAGNARYTLGELAEKAKEDGILQSDDPAKLLEAMDLEARGEKQFPSSAFESDTILRRRLDEGLEEEHSRWKREHPEEEPKTSPEFQSHMIETMDEVGVSKAARGVITDQIIRNYKPEDGPLEPYIRSLYSKKIINKIPGHVDEGEFQKTETQKGEKGKKRVPLQEWTENPETEILRGRPVSSFEKEYEDKSIGSRLNKHLEENYTKKVLKGQITEAEFANDLFIKDMSAKDIAIQRGISEAAVSKAKTKLFEKMKQDPELLDLYKEHNGMATEVAVKKYAPVVKKKVSQKPGLTIEKVDTPIERVRQIKEEQTKDVTFVDDPDGEVSKRFKRAAGRPKRTLPESVGRLIDIAHKNLTRVYPDLPHTGANMPLKVALKQFEASPAVNKDKAADMVKAMIEFEDGYTPYKQKLMTQKLILENEAENARLSKEDEPKLHFGFRDLEHVEKNLKAVNEELKKYPDVEKALKARQAIWDGVRKDTIYWTDKVGINVEPILNHRENYFRQQMIFDRAQDKFEDRFRKIFSGQKTKEGVEKPGYGKIPGSRKGIREPGKSGEPFLKRRGEAIEGLDYNTDLIEAESEVLHGLLMMQSQAKLIDAISKHDILPLVKKAAKEKGIEDVSKVKVPGYRMFKITERNLYYNAPSLPKYTADNLRLLVEAGDQEAIMEGLPEIIEKLRDRLIVGPKKEGMMLPDAWVKTLEKLVYHPPGFGSRVAHTLNAAFKVWATSSPRRIFKFSNRNMLGDAEISIVTRPSVIKEVGPAIKELWKVYVKHGPMDEEFRMFHEFGGMANVYFEQEIANNPQFTKMYKEVGKIDPTDLNLLKKYLQTTRVANDVREGILRYAMFRTLNREYDKLGDFKNYCCSIPDEIDAIPDRYLKAYWMSNETVGPYNLITRFGDQMRKFLLPFHAFPEINTRRYYRMIKNTQYELRAHRRELRNAIDNSNDLAVEAGRSAAKILSPKVKAFVLASPLMLSRLGKLLLKIMAFGAGLMAYNNLLFRDEEEALPEEVSPFHFILPYIGKDENGKNIISTHDPSTGEITDFTRIGLVNDVLEMFGIIDLPAILSDEFFGTKYNPKRGSIPDMIKNAWEGPVTQFWNELTPWIKTPIESAMKKTLFPDPLHPQSIRTRGLYLARQLALEDEYRALTKYPGKPYLETMDKFFTYKVNPFEVAYNETRDLRRDYYMETGSGSEGMLQTRRGDAAYYAKLGIKTNDPKATQYWLARFQYLYAKEAAYKGRLDSDDWKVKMLAAFEQSIESLNPLYGMSAEDQFYFMNSLDKSERQTVAKSLIWYNMVLMGDNLQKYEEYQREHETPPKGLLKKAEWSNFGFRFAKAPKWIERGYKEFEERKSKK